MMHSVTTMGLAAATAFIGASLASTSANVVRPIPRTQISHFRPSLSGFHAVPGRGNAFIGHAVYRGQRNQVSSDKKNKAGCIYVSDNLSGVITIFSGRPPYAEIGTLTSPQLYGWGVAAARGPKGNIVYAGTYSDTIDFYSPCSTGAPTGSVTGTGNYPYGMSVAPNGSLYAASWPSNTVDYWTAPVTSGEAASIGTDANQLLTYFVDADAAETYLTGYNTSESQETVDACSPTITSCATIVSIAGGFPGDSRIDAKGNLYVNNQYGTLYSYSGCPSACIASGTFTYSNGTNPLDYTSTALDAKAKNLWGADIYYCSSSYGLCGDGQAQSLPLSAAALDGNTGEISNAEPLGIALFPAVQPCSTGNVNQCAGLPPGFPPEIYNQWVLIPSGSPPTDFDVTFAGDQRNQIPPNEPLTSELNPFCPPSQTCPPSVTYNPSKNTTTVVYSGVFQGSNVPGHPGYAHFGLIRQAGDKHGTLKVLGSAWSYGDPAKRESETFVPEPIVGIDWQNTTSSTVGRFAYAAVYLQASFQPINANHPASYGTWNLIPYIPDPKGNQPQFVFSNNGSNPIYVDTAHSGIVLNIQVPSACRHNPTCADNMNLLRMLDFGGMPPPGHAGSAFRTMQYPPAPIIHPQTARRSQ